MKQFITISILISFSILSFAQTAKEKAAQKKIDRLEASAVPSMFETNPMDVDGQDKINFMLYQDAVSAYYTKNYRPAILHLPNGEKKTGYANVRLFPGELNKYSLMFTEGERTAPKMNKKEITTMERKDDGLIKAVITYENGFEDIVTFSSAQGGKNILSPYYKNGSVELMTWPYGLMRRVDQSRLFLIDLNSKTFKQDFIFIQSKDYMMKTLKASFIYKCDAVKAKLKNWSDEDYSETGLFEILDIYDSNCGGK